MKIHCAYDKLIETKELIPHPKNRNIHPQEQIDRLAKILLYQGWRYPVKVSKLSGFITSGHGRLLAAAKNGWNQVPVNYQDYEDEVQEYSDVQADNAIASWASLDLSGINSDIQDLGPFDVDFLGLKDFKVDVSELDQKTDDDSDKENPERDEQEIEKNEEIPEKIEPRTKLHDHFKIGIHELYNGDCLDRMKLLQNESIHSLITDPPAGIAFMGKDWDEDKGGSKEWTAWMTRVMEQAFRILKPGAHGLVWAIPRTSHWTATALEDAGFEIRDVVTHVFGSGFPKSMDISKVIDKQAGAEREVKVPNPHFVPGRKKGLNQSAQGTELSSGLNAQPEFLTIASTPDAKKWAGFGTALKPASEHWILVRKPISEKTIAANVLLHGVGGLNIDISRIKPNGEVPSQNIPSLSIPPNAYDGILKSFLDSFENITSLSLSQTCDFVERTFSVLDSYNKGDKDLLRNLAQAFRSQSTELSDALCDYGPSVLRVMQNAQSLLKSQDSQSDYPILFHLGDALIRSLKAFDLGVFPSLNDVRKCIYLLREEPENIRLNDSNLHLVCVWVFAWCLYKTIRLDIQPTSTPTGRFPSNFILSHNSTCVEVGTKKVKGHKGYPNGPGGNTFSVGKVIDGTRSEPWEGHASEDGTETVAAFECTAGCAVQELDRQSGALQSGFRANRENHKHNKPIYTGASLLTSKTQYNPIQAQYADSGGASRFFYIGKPSKREKNEGVDESVKKAIGARPNSGDLTGKFPDHDQRERVGNFHPTVKSLKLMSYLINMVTPSGGTLIDPFGGSGTTLVASELNGFKSILFEQSTEYCDIILARAEKVTKKKAELLNG